jgi:hypothetical protein
MISVFGNFCYFPIFKVMNYKEAKEAKEDGLYLTQRRKGGEKQILLGINAAS